MPMSMNTMSGRNSLTAARPFTALWAVRAEPPSSSTRIAIVVAGSYARTLPMHRVQKGDLVVCGFAGLFVVSRRLDKLLLQ